MGQSSVKTSKTTTRGGNVPRERRPFQPLIKERGDMTGYNKGLIIALVASVGLWGCARGPASGSAAAERIKALEFKVGKLEEDFRAAASARDVLRSRLASAEEQRSRLESEVERVVSERDELRKQVAARVAERDTVQAQFEQFRKGIRELLGQADVASAAVGMPVTASAPSTTSAKAQGG
jgi:septal ring factor EnvC (AmiA/AmiB activator)